MFEDRLRKLRLARGLSQQETANALGLKVNTYRNYENNEREPSSMVLIRLGKYFGVTLDYLLDYHCDKSIKEDNINEHINLTNKEVQHIKKYRTLDEHGRKIVDFSLNEEYKRCTDSQSETINILTAARSVDGKTPIQHEKMTKEEFEKLYNAPEANDDF